MAQNNTNSTAFPNSSTINASPSSSTSSASSSSPSSSTSSSSSSSSSSIKLQSLEKEFDVVMKMYEEAYKTYVSSMSDNIVVTSGSDASTTAPPTKYIVLKNHNYWGKTGLKEGTVNSSDECQTMCSDFGNCEGATYNSSKNYCWARSGEGKVALSDDPDDNAIVPQLKLNAIILKTLNDKLIDLNTQINSELSATYGSGSGSGSSSASGGANNGGSSNGNGGGANSVNLTDQLDKLTKEKAHINELMAQVGNIDADFKDTQINVTQSNVQYVFYFIIALILVSMIVGNSTFSKLAIVLISLSIIIGVSMSHT